VRKRNQKSVSILNIESRFKTIASIIFFLTKTTEGFVSFFTKEDEAAAGTIRAAGLDFPSSSELSLVKSMTSRVKELLYDEKRVFK